MATVPSNVRLSDQTSSAPAWSVSSLAAQTLQLFGSLKLTVALFAFSLVLVFAGTLAQHHLNMLQVKERYFTSWIALMHFEDLVPNSFYMHEQPFRGFIPVPGGALVGTLLLLNLLAAKITRFRIHASGPRLVAGIGVIVLGLLATLGIVLAGQSSEGLQGEPPMSYPQLWGLCLGTLAATWIGVTALAITAKSRTMRITWIVASLAVAAYLIFSLSTGHRIGDPGLRIVWQLAKGLGAGLILLVGCLLIFKKQGGNVLLHFGVGLLMVGQFMFGDRQTEQRLNLVEGQSANAFVNMDKVEMTFIREADGQQQFTAIPHQQLRQAAESKAVIRDEALPVDVKVLAYHNNSRLVKPSADTLTADRGIGQEVAAIGTPGSGGTSSEVDLASAYVELLDKQSGESLGTHLISQWFSDRALAVDGGSRDEFDTVTLDDTEYKVGLRFARNPKPFWIHLNEVRRVDYSGTDTPRDYRSFIRIIDPESGEDRREQIWMNNPLRFRGETYYQSNYTRLPSGAEMTGLQIVQNSGWLIPYVACSITALGMCVHFGGTLRRFVRRRNQEQRLAREKAAGRKRGAKSPYASLAGGEGESDALASGQVQTPSRMPIVLGVGAVALFAVLALVPWPAVMNNLRPAQRDRDFDLYAAGEIPVQFGGRVMPLAAYAQQTLKAISNRSAL